MVQILVMFYVCVCVRAETKWYTWLHCEIKNDTTMFFLGGEVNYFICVMLFRHRT